MQNPQKRCKKKKKILIRELLLLIRPYFLLLQFCIHVGYHTLFVMKSWSHSKMQILHLSPECAISTQFTSYSRVDLRRNCCSLAIMTKNVDFILLWHDVQLVCVSQQNILLHCLYPLSYYIITDNYLSEISLCLCFVKVTVVLHTLLSHRKY